MPNAIFFLSEFGRYAVTIFLNASSFYSQPTVDIKTVLSRLMDRLSNYAVSSADVSYPYCIFACCSVTLC